MSLPCNVMRLHGYPSMDFASFVTGVQRYILLLMWFYNMLLKLNGYTCKQWIRLKEKTILSTLSQVTFQTSFDKDNPDVKTKQPSSLCMKYSRIAALAMMNLAGAQGDFIQLQSETQLRKKLQKFCNTMNGSFDINCIPDGEVKWPLCTNLKIQNSANSFNDLIRNAPDSYTGILDTGTNWNAINNPSLCIPNSIKLLDTPSFLMELLEVCILKRLVK
jgi:hypothetical protein